MTTSLSKSEQIQNRIRRQVREGRLKPGDRLPPERELTEVFGVSRVTLNRALSALSSEELLDRTQGRGTFVRKDVDRGVVLCVFSLNLLGVPGHSPYFDLLMTELSVALKGAGFRGGFVLGKGGDAAEFAASIEPNVAAHHRLAGVITTHDLGPLEASLREKQLPVVHLASNPAWRYVALHDYVAMAQMAVGHLLQRGCRRIGLIAQESPGDPHRAAAGVERALADAGLSLDPHRCRFHCKNSADGERAMRDIWNQRGRPDGVVVSDDMVARGVARAVRQLGIRLPDQLRLIAEASDAVTLDEPVEWTTCQFEIARTCRAAVALLSRLLRKPEIDHRTVRIRPRLKTGATT